MSDGLNKITPFIVMDILKKAREIPDAIHMEVGEPDLPPPPGVEEAFKKAIRDRKFFYTPACGLFELREKISEHYQKIYNVEISPERIIITPGTSGAFLIAMRLFIEKGKRLILSDPTYPCYKNFAYFLGIGPYSLPCGKETSYEITPERLKDIDGGALLVSSPANPVGNLYRPDTFKGLIEHCKKNKIWFISDEIYHGLVYDEKEHTALEFSGDAIVISGFSKYFCMPGLRLGWMIIPQKFIRRAEILVQNIFIAANTPAQYAAVDAFDYDYLKTVRDTFRGRRDLLYSELKDIFEIDVRPSGAFYIWADISRYMDNSLRFCEILLKEKAVAITPGIDFGKNRTERYVRFAYTTDLSHLKEGVRRIREFLASL